MDGDGADSAALINRTGHITVGTAELALCNLTVSED